MAAPAAAAQGDGAGDRIETVDFDWNGDADPIGPGERITATLMFSDLVTVSGSPQLALEFGGVTLRFARPFGATGG